MLAAARKPQSALPARWLRPLPGAVDELMTPSGEIRSHWLPVLAEMAGAKAEVSPSVLPWRIDSSRIPGSITEFTTRPMAAIGPGRCRMCRW